MRIHTGWKEAVVVALSGVIFALASCGGGGIVISGLSRRAFVSDDADGSIHIEDAIRDEESAHTIGTGAQPGNLRLSPEKSFTLVFNAGSLTMSVIQNSTETVLESIVFPAVSTDYAMLPGDGVAFAVVPNSGTTPCIPRCVVMMSLATSNNASTFQITATISVDATGAALNAASTMALSPDGHKLLVFGAPGEHVDTLTFVDAVAAQSATPPPASATTQLGPANCGSLPASCFDRPVSAVFSSDSTKAFVFNCGPECAGTTPSVTVLDMTQSPPVPSANVPLPGAAATIGLLNGTTLYVAGSPPGLSCAAATPPTSATSCGTLLTIDTGTLAVSAPTIIANGLHSQMELASNNQLFIGARTCTNVSTASETRGCLTIFDTSGNKVVVPPVNFDVTGIAPILHRTVVYVIQGGDLKIYDTTTDALTAAQIDIVGKAVDVKYVDQ